MKKILVVDDSALMRRVISDIINKDKQLETSDYAADGLQALHILESGKHFDVIVLDIHMPNMDGLEFLRVLNQKGIRQKVVIVSTLAKEGAKETLEALELGAFDFITKPDKLAEVKGVSFNRTLIQMLYAACDLDISQISLPSQEEEKKGRTYKPVNYGIRRSVWRATSQDMLLQADRNLHSKAPLGSGTKKLVALACSTGGPKSLQQVIPFLPANLDAAVLLVQHMPAGFTESLGKRLDELSKIHVKEAESGEQIQKGTVYIARGGSQMRLIEKGKDAHCIALSEEPPRNGLRPCADIMYESLMESSFDEITCVVMTGMGADGTRGILQLEKTNKIYVIAQDEASCIVYGMPKMIAEAGAVDEVQSLKNIADAITKHVGVQ